MTEEEIKEDNEEAEDVYDRIDYFDAGDAWAPVTLREKMKDDTGKKQELVLVKDQFEHIYEESATISQDPFVNATVGSINNALTAVDDKVRQINLSFAKGEEKIYSSAKDALEQLRLETDMKLAKLDAVERELLRREYSLKKAQTYFDDEREKSKNGNLRKKVDFIQMYVGRASEAS